MRRYPPKGIVQWYCTHREAVSEPGTCGVLPLIGTGNVYCKSLCVSKRRHSRDLCVRLAMLENRRESSCRESIRPKIIKTRITNTSSLGHGPSNPMAHVTLTNFNIWNFLSPGSLWRKVREIINGEASWEVLICIVLVISMFFTDELCFIDSLIRPSYDKKSTNCGIHDTRNWMRKRGEMCF